MRRRIVRRRESEPESVREKIKVGAWVYAARSSRGPLGRVVGLSRSGRLLVQWQGPYPTITLCKPSILRLVENPDQGETEDEIPVEPEQ